MGSQGEKKKINVKIIFLIAVFLFFFLPILLEIPVKAELTDESLNSKLFEALRITGETDLEFVEFLNVGQGDCTLIKSGGKAALIDCGLEDEYGVIYKRLLKLGIKKIDLLVITHHHNDHMGGFEGLIKNIPIDRLIISTEAAEDAEENLYKEAISLAKAYGVKLYSPKVGSSFKIGNAALKVLYVSNSADDENNRSIVTMLSMGGKRLLFTGDSEKEIENYITENCDIDCDILKMGHHGSSTSSTTEFLKKASPKIAIASCGYDNLYNHPSKSAVLRVEELEIKIYRTDLDRNIRCSFDSINNSFWVNTERGGSD